MALTDIGYLSSTKNIGSEMELLRSRTIVEQVVKEMKLYITYQVEDNFAMRDLYESNLPYKYTELYQPNDWLSAHR